MRLSSMALQSTGSGCNIYNHFGAASEIQGATSRNRLGQNPANRGAADPQTAGNLGLADTRTMQFSHLVGLESRRHRPAQALAVALGVRQTSAYPFPQNLPFELGKHGQ